MDVEYSYKRMNFEWKKSFCSFLKPFDMWKGGIGSFPATKAVNVFSLSTVILKMVLRGESFLYLNASDLSKAGLDFFIS